MALDHRLLDEDGNIDLAQWQLRHAASLGVGTCERLGCRGQLVAAGSAPFERVGGVRWLTVECNGCGHEMLSPNGRLAPRPRALVLS
jgi:hypothetical protein